MSRIGPNRANTAITEDHVDNSLYCFGYRESGLHIEKEITVTGTGAITANVLQFTGTIVIMNQFAELTEVTTLTNATGVYADIYDGTNAVDLTADGLVLSNAPVGSFFTKDKISTETFTANIADQCRLLETLGTKKAGRPFIVTAKPSVDNFIRFNLTTTDNPVNFKIRIVFEYRPVDGGTLEFL